MKSESALGSSQKSRDDPALRPAPPTTKWHLNTLFPRRLKSLKDLGIIIIFRISVPVSVSCCWSPSDFLIE